MVFNPTEENQHQHNITRLIEEFSHLVNAEEIKKIYGNIRQAKEVLQLRQFIPLLTLKQARDALYQKINNLKNR